MCDPEMSNDGASSSKSSPEESALGSLEEGRGCRSKKLRQHEPIYCPICGLTVRVSELETHYNSHLTKLDSMSGGRYHHFLNKGPGGSPNETSSKTWDTFQKVKSNRETRLRVKSRKRKASEVTCPICSKMIPADDIALHVELCLDRNEGGNNLSSDSESIDVEGDEQFEEYEWAGQRRVRVSTLVTGAVPSTYTTIQKENGQESEELIVDEDDTQIFGQPQYSEKDVVVLEDLSEEEPHVREEREALRKAVIGGGDGSAVSADSFTSNGGASSNTSDDASGLPVDQPIEELVANSETDDSARATDPVIAALKLKIEHLENRPEPYMYRCFICMDNYKTPVVSIRCWHVCCEQCWLKTLGAKKLCPKCQGIISPSDLRRIYL